VFADDAEALDALSKASEGFEHGYMLIPDVRALAEPVLERAARKVRRALISVLDLDAAVAGELLDPDLDEPRGMVPALKVLRGEVHVTDPSVAPGKLADAVEVDWESQGEREVERNAEGKLTVTGTTKATFRGCPDGVALTVTSSGMRVQGATDYRTGEPIVRRADGSLDSRTAGT
jgi:hypothetical protein